MMALKTALPNYKFQGPPGGINPPGPSYKAPDTTFYSGPPDADLSGGTPRYVQPDGSTVQYGDPTEYAMSPGLIFADKLGISEPYRSLLGALSPEAFASVAALSTQGVTTLLKKLSMNVAKRDDAKLAAAAERMAKFAKKEPVESIPTPTTRGLPKAVVVNEDVPLNTYISKEAKRLADEAAENDIPLTPYLPKPKPQPPTLPPAALP